MRFVARIPIWSRRRTNSPVATLPVRVAYPIALIARRLSGVGKPGGEVEGLHLNRVEK